MTIIFKEVAKTNFYDVCNLSKTLNENQKKSVADNSFSIAEAIIYPNNAYYRAIYDDDLLVGFFMVFIPDEMSKEQGQTDFFLWRYMISGKYQRRGYGKNALSKIIAFAKELHYEKVVTSCELGEESPFDFYTKFGFIPKDQKIGTELVLEYILK